MERAMTTLIAVYDGCEGRCDERCYGAKHKECKCICCGRNHGAGLAQAEANTRALAQGWIDAYKREHAEVAGELVFDVPAAQLRLI
jgi:hypothetical protein